MPLVLKNINNYGYTLGVWEVVEQESFFLNNISLNTYDQEILGEAKSRRRRLDFLSIRYLAMKLGIYHTITYTPTGKPIIEKGNISISHSKRYSAIIYDQFRPVALDIEKITNILDKSKHLVFNDSEIQFAENNLTLLTILWCCKECVVKMTDNLKVNFLTDIFIPPFKVNSSIDCYYKSGSTVRQFKFSYMKISDHILVMGLDSI